MRRAPRIESLLAHLPIFEGLAPGDLTRLAAATTRRTLARGAMLFREGEPSTGIHAVVYGRIRLFNTADDGRERLFDMIGPRRSFGEPVMFLEKPYIVSARAAADSLVLHIAKDAVFAELHRNPRFASRIIGSLAQRAEALVHQLQDHAVGSGARRFVAWLLRQPGAQSRTGAASLMLPMTKRELAARLNLSAEHLSRIFRELSDKDLVAIHGRKVSIPDIGRLRSWRREAA